MTSQFGSTLTIVAVSLVLTSGCVGKKLFRETVESNDARVGSVETAVEANERRISDIRDETDRKVAELSDDVDAARRSSADAMTAAERAQTAADDAARGRLLWTVTLSDESVKFPFGGAALPTAATDELDTLIDRIKGYGKAVYVEIEGHTDSIGAEDYNLELGERRAESVRNYLSGEGGIPLHAINTISFGESRPVADNGSPAGRSQNRRVVIRVLE